MLKDSAFAYSFDDALLVLEDGTVMVGEPYGACGMTCGEIVFNTGMTGYQETLSDPSYDGQIVVQTFPHIGDTGVNDDDNESAHIWVAGYVVRDPSPISSNWRATDTLDHALQSHHIIGMCDIDTRALVRHIRDHGAMHAGIFSGDALSDERGRLRTVDDLLDIVRASEPMNGRRLFDEVSTNETYVIEPMLTEENAHNNVRADAQEGVRQSDQAAAQTLPQSLTVPLTEPLTVVAVDLGIKAMTPKLLAQRSCRVIVVPSTISFDELMALNPDGVFFSNGPGDPQQADDMVALLRKVLDARVPFFGICFGNQLLARALGFDTYKLKFGHRGINQPVQNLETGEITITAHNHGFAVDMPIGEPVVTPYGNGSYGRAHVTHIDLNDQVVEGLACLDIPAFSVQYHPEAAAGPHDGAQLFDQFIELMRTHAQSQPTPSMPLTNHTSHTASTASSDSTNNADSMNDTADAIKATDTIDAIDTYEERN